MQKKLNLKTLVILFVSLIVVFLFLAWVRITTIHKLGQAYSNLPALQSDLKNTSVNFEKKPAIDLSAYQPYKSVNYAKLAKNISAAIVRVQDGIKATPSIYINKDGSDPAFKYHITGLQEQGIPVAVYAYANATTKNQMIEEAKSFYERAKAYQPTSWWVDVESPTMKDLNGGVEAFRSELEKLGAKNIGIYSRDDFLTENNIDTSKFDGTWLAYYGQLNDGSFTALNIKRSYQIQQYTDQLKIDGYAGPIDHDRILSTAAYKKFFLNMKN
ncbi:MAG TPA: GH25 family lysozyme [Lactovum miscens]|uniref:GH25 family lysozyme n=1 Tax=Lactovum miscens TaxID=190387 RepID=UPI002ED98F3D